MKPISLHAAGRCALLVLVVLVSLSANQPRAGAQSISDKSYVSKQFGRQIAWPSPWLLLGSEAEAEYDRLSIQQTAETPIAPSAANHARLVFDPNVIAQDRELIAESVRLAEDFFAIRFGAALGADVTVTALPISGPHDEQVIAATLGSSIVIYTGSLGWVDSPPAERMRTVIHEYTHAYQNSKTADHQFESAAWLEEGAAEYLSMVALAELGLVNRDAMEGYFGIVVMHTELPPLQELERYGAMQSQSGEVYPLMYFGVDSLLEDLPLAAIDDYYSDLQQGTPFATAFEQAFDVTPGLFYDEFEWFRATSLPTIDHYPVELEITEGIDRPGAVDAADAPVFVIPGQQALVVAQSLPGANCTLDLRVAGTPVVIDDRATFANGVGQVFWIVTIPAGLPSGQGVFALTCGADPLTLPVLLS